MSGQPAMGSHMTKRLMRMALCPGKTFMLVAGDSLYCYEAEEVTADVRIKRLDEAKSLMKRETWDKLETARKKRDDFEEEEGYEAEISGETGSDFWKTLVQAIREHCPPKLAQALSWVTDTSTSDLRIAGFSKPLMDTIAEIMSSVTKECTDQKHKNRFTMLKSHIKSIHSPYIAVCGARDIMRLNGLASGAFLHEIATAVATCIPVLSAMDTTKAKSAYEVLGRISAILPQGEKVVEDDDGVQHLESLPEGSSEDLLFHGGHKILGLHHVVWDLFEQKMIETTGDLPVALGVNVKGR